jgi:putative Mg2+ transporter-C (MgtC) family protein
MLVLMETLGNADVALRIGAALITGLLVGWERESRGRPAGLRTTILTCTAAALAMVLSQILFRDSSLGAPPGTWRPDPARLGAGILTGIGFLGAGTIMRHENVVRGVTTAASLWFVTVVGLTFGAGQFLLGAIGSIVVILVLAGLPLVEKHLQRDRFANLSFTAGLNAISEETVRHMLGELGARVKSCEILHDLEQSRSTTTYVLHVSRPRLEATGRAVLKYLTEQPGMLQVSWK